MPYVEKDKDHLHPGTRHRGRRVLRRLMLGGMNAARFNFSHCTHEDAAKKLEAVTRLREELNLPIATILDTKGPEIRVKTFEKGPSSWRLAPPSP